MIKRITLLLCLFLLFLIFPSQADIAISGQVLDQDGASVSYAFVKLLEYDVSVYANNNGEFSIEATALSSALSSSHSQKVWFNKRNLIINSEKSQNITVKMFSINGKLVKTMFFGKVNSGKNILPINFSDFDRGFWVIKVSTMEKQHIFKMNNGSIKQNSGISEVSTKVANRNFVRQDFENDTLMVTKEDYDTAYVPISYSDDDVRVTINKEVILKEYAVIDPNRCNGCGRCRNSCSLGALYQVQNGWQILYEIDKDLCDGCGDCIRYCPKGAIYIVEGE